MAGQSGKFAYEDLIRDVKDYPKEGVVFKDITPLLADPDGFHAAIDDIAEHFAGKGITKVIGSEARGFIIGAPVAYAIGAGLVPARKPGKLPGETISEEYDLEYGSDRLEVLVDAFTEDDVVLVVDDLVATGGTAIAQANLVKRCGAKLAGFGFLMELDFLSPRKHIEEQVGTYDIYSSIHVQ